MIRFLSCLLLLLSTVSAGAAPEVCTAAAREIEASLRAFGSGAEGTPISIAASVADRAAAGLDFGTKLDEAALEGFPLSEEQRATFGNAERLIYRSGDLNGLVMLDAVRGTARCHAPLLFSTATGVLEPVKTPVPGDPFELCLYGGLALGYAAGTPFYAETENDGLETDVLKIFPSGDNGLSHACTVAAAYTIAYETAETSCKDQAVCASLAPAAAKWAGQFRSTGGTVNDGALSHAGAPDLPGAQGGEFPLPGGAASSLVPEPFRFDGSEAWFSLTGGGKADLARIGPAAEGPASVASWKSFTLVAIYRGGAPLASFVVEKRRSGFKSLSLRDLSK